MNDSNYDMTSHLLAQAERLGADSADALFVQHRSTNVEIRDGNVEELEHAHDVKLGLRVFCGQKSAMVSMSNPTQHQSTVLAERAVAMARILPDDPYAGLCPQAQKGTDDKNALELVDTQTQLSTSQLITYAQHAEKAALGVKDVTKSAGSDASWDHTKMSLQTTGGFAGSYQKTFFSVGACVLAGEGENMQRDFDFDVALFHKDLNAPAQIGENAGHKTVARLNPHQPKTGNYSCVFAPRVANNFLQHFAQLTNGKAIANGTSLFINRLGDQIFPKDVSIKDEPRRLKGLRSRPFDAEGVRTSALYPVQHGQLQHWFLDNHCARQLGLVTHGQASRSTGSQPSPSPSNLYFEPGRLTPSQLMADIDEGIYITEMMGLSLNPLTGDYSRGASGFMIRQGEIAEPISGFTLAGNLIDIFSTIKLADDLSFKFGINAPTLRTEGLHLAGS